MKHHVLKTGLLFLWSGALYAQQIKAPPPPLANPPLPWPSGLVAPWRTLGIDPDALRTARKALKASHQTLAQKVIETPTNLLDSRGLTPPIKARVRALEFLSGTLKKQDIVSNHRPPSALIEPVWCSLYQYHVLILTLTHSTTNQLLASTHQGVEKKQWELMLKNQSLETYLNQKLSQMADDLAVAPPRPPQSPSAFQIALLLKRESTRRDEGNSWCLNLLLEEALSQKTTVVRSLGADHLLALNNLFRSPPTPKRPTRYGILDWNPPPQKPPLPQKRLLPPFWSLTLEFAEGVFGKSIPLPNSPPVTLDWSLGDLKPATVQGGDRNLWNVVIPQPLLDVITQENQALTLADQPLVVKTQGAWAYLDRGRGWGLAMGDRLVAENGQVKGHVVRYFGPELSLKSSRGFPIHEGAIVYIRKGQKAVRPGTVFTYDQTVFPAPWPPANPQSNKRAPD